MTDAGFELIMREGRDPASATHKPPLPPLGLTVIEEDGLVFERNHPVQMRDGVTIYCDIYRPAGPLGESGLPILLAWSPYGKHGKKDNLWEPAGIEPGWISRHTAFEAPDPAFWCPLGYAIAYPDARGAWLSEGNLRHNGLGEGEDIHDLIEWLADRPWGNGKVGMTGVSYLAAAQYLVAPLKPRGLAALNPWEGFSDWYREFAYHGGIPETCFIERASLNLSFSTGLTEYTGANARAHPLIDAYWHSKALDLEAIDLPMFVVASWSDHGLHTRGTFEAYERAASQDKWLLVHGQKKWRHYYDPESLELQRQFFDHYLKGTDDRVLAWPKVRLQVRESGSEGAFRDEAAWPIARTGHAPLHLDAARGSLTPHVVEQADTVRYDPLDAEGRATFDYRFQKDTEITGRIKLRLWAEADGADDMDIFVGLQKLDADGNVVPFAFYALYDDGPLALGWLRASHRALDVGASRPDKPVHLHTREEPMPRGEAVPLEIEIWPTSVKFHAGEILRLIVQGQDIFQDDRYKLAFARHEDLRNTGRHVLHAGGTTDSYLLLPIVD